MNKTKRLHEEVMKCLMKHLAIDLHGGLSKCCMTAIQERDI